MIAGTYDLATTGRATGNDLRHERDVAVLVGQRLSGEVVDRQLDGLFGGNTNQLRNDTRVQATETLIADDLLETVERVLVQALAGLGASLVLQSCLDQIDRVHHKGTKGTSNTTQGKVVGRL